MVTDYYRASGLQPFLDALGFNLVGYGCTTCIGNSGPLPEEIADEIHRENLVACAALSGNRNFEGRINSDVRANYLMSPPLVVAFALAGRIDVDLSTEPLGTGSDGRPVFLRDIWPSRAEIEEVLNRCVQSEMFRKSYARGVRGRRGLARARGPGGRSLRVGPRVHLRAAAAVLRRHGSASPASASTDISRRSRVIAVLGDSVTTDHISPAGSIKKDSPAGQYLIEKGVAPPTSTPTARAAATTR